MSNFTPLLVVWASLAAPPAVDADGEALPRGALARLGTTRLRPGGPIESVAWSADGRTLLSVCGAGDYGLVHLWDAASGRLRDQFPVGHAATFSPDGRRVLHVCPDKYAVAVRDLSAGRAICEAEGGYPAAFAPDGRSIVFFRAPHLILAEADTGQEIRQFGQVNSKQDAVWAVAFSPDGKTLAALHDDELVRLWDPATGKELRQVPAVGVTTLVFAPDGKTLALGGAAVRLIDLNDGHVLWEMEDLDGVNAQLTFAPDGRTLATANKDGSVRLLDTANGAERRRLLGHRSRVWGVAFAPDGRGLVSGGDDGIVRRWDATTGEPLQPSDAWPVRTVALAVAPDGRALTSADMNGRLALWDTNAAQPRRLEEDASPPSMLAYGPDGVLVTAGSTGMTFRDGDTGRVRGRTPTDNPVLAWSAAGHLLVCRYGELVDATTGKVVRTLATSPRAAALAADGRTLVAGGSEGLTRFEVASGNKVDGWEQRLDDPALCAFQALVMSPDGRFVAGCDRDGAIRLWSLAEGWRQLNLEGGAGFGVPALSPDGRLVAAGGRDGSVHVWEIASARLLTKLHGHRGPFPAVAFLPDGRRLASAGAEGSVVLWDWAVPTPNAPDLFHRADREHLWAALTDEGPAGLDALRNLLAAGDEGVVWLGDKLRAAPGLTDAQIGRLLEQLDDDSFEVRQAACASLMAQGRQIAPHLHRFLLSKPSLEAARRVEDILAALDQKRPGPWLNNEERRATRAVQALERSASPEARRLLAVLAKGGDSAVLTREARASLARLASPAHP